MLSSYVLHRCTATAIAGGPGSPPMQAAAYVPVHLIAIAAGRPCIAHGGVQH